jgi:hypothetical protein
MAGTEDATFHWGRFLTLIAISGGTLAGALGATNPSTRWLVPLWIISGSCAIAATVYGLGGLVRWARKRRSNQETPVPDKDTESEPGVEDVTRKLFELLEVNLELTKQLLEAQTKASPAVVEQAVERAAAQGRISLRSSAKGQVITRRETVYDEEGRVAGDETVYDDGHRDAAVHPKTVAAEAAVPGLAEPPGELEDEILQLVKNRARSLSELQTLTGAAKDFLKAATASLEAKGKVTLKGSEVKVTVRPATEAPPMEVPPHRHPEPPRLPTPNLRPKTPAKSSPLTIEGGDGDDFDWTLPVMETYRRLENAHALASGEYVIEAGSMKVLRVTNTSDLGVENVRAEVTLDDGKISANLVWVHNDAEIADIAPHSSRHVVLAMWTKLGISVQGLHERQYDRNLGYAALPNNSVLRVKAWAPGTVSATAAFRVGTRGLMSLIQPLSLTPVDDQEHSP